MCNSFIAIPYTDKNNYDNEMYSLLQKGWIIFAVINLIMNCIMYNIFNKAEAIYVISCVMSALAAFSHISLIQTVFRLLKLQDCTIVQNFQKSDYHISYTEAVSCLYCRFLSLLTPEHFTHILYLSKHRLLVVTVLLDDSHFGTCRCCRYGVCFNTKGLN